MIFHDHVNILWIEAAAIWSEATLDACCGDASADADAAAADEYVC